MLALLGLLVIVVLLASIMTKRLSPLIALIIIPFIGAIVSGADPHTTSKFVIEGLRSIVPAAGMFVFAILFFGVMSDAGMLDPIINGVLKVVGTSPTRITMGTLFLTLLIHLDGSGAVTFMLVVPAMLPLYDLLGMDKRILACMAALGAGVNFLPWVGPMIRSSAVLNISAIEIFNPLIPVQICGLALSFFFAYMLGKREEKRLRREGCDFSAGACKAELTEKQLELRRPRLFWINVFITVGVIFVMITNILSAAVSFMIGTVLALVINYPHAKLQRARVDAHAKPAMMMASILMAAGAFVGIMKGTGMTAAMAKAIISFVPHEMTQHIPFALGIVGMPLTLFFDPDSFYFGVMPVIAEVYKNAGGNPIQIAQAALLGACTTGFPVSPLTPAPFLLVGLAGIEFGEHQKYSIPFLWMASIAMTFAAAFMGVIPF
jgi:CitMHS family citrate-Mg2+:H+ or citrate-Ca2+:H+ symporter